jgi:hypothetical protein
VYIAIDDTYGPHGNFTSEYVTGSRRTHVAVVFEDSEVSHIRKQVQDCLNYISELLPTPPTEFHFVDIYNRKGVWNSLPKHANLSIFEAFAEIYRQHHWKVFLQTIDNLTIADHPVMLKLPSFDGLDTTNRADLSLYWLCIKLRLAFKETKPPIKLFVDQGVKGPGKSFGNEIFCDWGDNFSGEYSSSTEPLVQIVDFMAFIVNRSTYLSIKEVRTETDNWFLNLVGTMEIYCAELPRRTFSKNFTIADFDNEIRIGRLKKGFRK